MLFIDFKQTYDKIPRRKLTISGTLDELGKSKELIRLMEMTLRNAENMVKTQTCITAKLEDKQGLRQGDP